VIPSDPSTSITVPQVANTPAGANELELFRRQQLINTGVAWAVPAVSLIATLLFHALELGVATGLAGLVAVLSGSSAPGLSFVFWMRRRQARHLVEGMPQLPRAQLRIGPGRRTDA
jgi:hypothetical protein